MYGFLVFPFSHNYLFFLSKATAIYSFVVTVGDTVIVLLTAWFEMSSDHLSTIVWGKAVFLCMKERNPRKSTFGSSAAAHSHTIALLCGFNLAPTQPRNPCLKNYTVIYITVRHALDHHLNGNDLAEWCGLRYALPSIFFCCCSFFIVEYSDSTAPTKQQQKVFPFVVWRHSNSNNSKYKLSNPQIDFTSLLREH